MKSVHRFRVVASFGPGDLLHAMQAIARRPDLARDGVAFDFDWLKRRIAFRARTTAALDAATDLLLDEVNRRAGPALLLPGDFSKTPDGLHEQPIGVLLQTPDVFVDVMVGALREFGIASARAAETGDAIDVPARGGPAAFLDHVAFLKEFPLPPYLRLVDDGEVEVTVATPAVKKPAAKKKRRG